MKTHQYNTRSRQSFPVQFYKDENEGDAIGKASALPPKITLNDESHDPAPSNELSNGNLVNSHIPSFPLQLNKDGEKVQPEHDSSAFSGDKAKQETIKLGFENAHIMVTKAIPKIDVKNSHYKKFIDGGLVDSENMAARASHVKNGFEKMKTHLEEKKTTMKKWDLPADHKFKENTTYGYVKTAEEEANIYLGGVFWKAPDTGLDSKAGTIIHELTHKLYSTVDHGYGLDNTYKFAKDEPQKGYNNADNHEHFAEKA